MESSEEIGRLPRRRQMAILAELSTVGSVRVSSLAKRFGVAEETIRRDLDKLGSEGLLTRTHGGAVDARSELTDLPINVRRATSTVEKRHMARRALQFIQPGDVIGMDASSSVLELAMILPNEPLTVVTNGIDVARILTEHSEVRVVLVGGELDPASLCTQGPLAEDSLRSFALGKSFLSCKGIDAQRGFSEASLAHSAVKRSLIEAADRSFLLADHAKFGVRSLTFFGEIGDIDCLISDCALDNVTADAFKEAGVSVEVAGATTVASPSINSLESAC